LNKFGELGDMFSSYLLNKAKIDPMKMSEAFENFI
jgi:hypothetical protein